MIKVTALTGSKHDASSRFRIRQFIEPLRKLGVDVTEYWPLISRYKLEPLPWLVKLLRRRGLRAARLSEVTWLGRELMSGRVSDEPTAGPKRLFDVDDAIWLPYESQAKEDFSAEIVKHCAGVIAGNRYLADHYERLGSRVWLVPTSVDTDKWLPAPKANTDKWTIGWSGSWSNLKFLYSIEEPLAEFLTRYRDARLLVVCDRRPVLNVLPRDSWLFVEWNMENEIGLLQLMDVGLMPLEHSEWSLGKCGFKMLSYMAVGLPVIVSPVGVNAEVLARAKLGLPATTNEDWYQTMKAIYADRAMASRMGQTGRRIVEEHYSVRTNVKKLATIFQEVVAE